MTRDHDGEGEAAPELRALVLASPTRDHSSLRDLSPPDLSNDDRARVDHFLDRASADATLRAYRSDWRLFTTWCGTRGYSSLPASPIVTAAFLSELASDGSAHSNGRPLSKSSIGRRLAAIVFAHRAAELEPPTAQAGAAALDRVMRGIRNAKRGDRPAKKRPADSDVLRDMVRHISGSSLIDYRDRALLSIGMMGAFRRSELVAINVADVDEDARYAIASPTPCPTGLSDRRRSASPPTSPPYSKGWRCRRETVQQRRNYRTSPTKPLPASSPSGRSTLSDLPVKSDSRWVDCRELACRGS